VITARCWQICWDTLASAPPESISPIELSWKERSKIMYHRSLFVTDACGVVLCLTNMQAIDYRMAELGPFRAIDGRSEKQGSIHSLVGDIIANYAVSQQV